MKQGGIVIWLVIALALFIVGVQLHSRGYFTKKPAEAAQARPQAEPLQTDKAGVVTVFGREFSEAQVREWYGRVSGRYGYRDGIVFAVGTASGEPLTYDKFVCALKMGFHFPELAGEGVLSDGETIVLSHEGLLRRKADRGPSATVRIVRPVGPMSTVASTDERVPMK